MRIGVIFPQNEIGTDPGVIREYAQAVEELGYTHILATDHVLGASMDNRPDLHYPHTHESLFHEPFVLFGYLAAITRHIELMTGVIILTQRQTALVAKQAAEVDVLSGGRLRLGIGVGWNAVEFEGMGENFLNRGTRIVEQVEVLRALWTQPVVTFHGRWHHISEAGINPLPIQRPIPIWFGGHAEATLRRIGQLGDGWYPLHDPGDEVRAMISRIHSYAHEAGRDPSVIGIETWLRVNVLPEHDWTRYVQAWRELGATHMTVDTTGANLASPRGHIELLRRVKDVLRV
jgi:probable F420-dependent oxidoreductase